MSAFEQNKASYSQAMHKKTKQKHNAIQIFRPDKLQLMIMCEV